MNNNITISTGHLYINEHPFASDAHGRKTVMCWPEDTNLSWLDQVIQVLAQGGNPNTAEYKTETAETLHFKLSCYHGGDGWWFDLDDTQSDQELNYRLFIPAALEFHPNHEKIENTKGE